MNIKKVAVIGSGTMGRGIAAQVANAGIPVFLLDLPSAEGSRNQIVENAKENILKSKYSETDEHILNYCQESDNLGGFKNFLRENNIENILIYQFTKYIILTLLIT